MQSKPMPRLRTAVLLTIGVLASAPGNASTLGIDAFTHFQSVMDRGSTPGSASNTVVNLTGTDLANASRSIVAHANGTTRSDTEAVISGAGYLDVLNGGYSNGNLSITWNFDPINFTNYGNAIQMDVLNLDHSVNVEMVINGSSSSGVKTISDLGKMLVDFSAFANNDISNVSSLRLNFSSSQVWDLRFKLQTASTVASIPPIYSTPVPVPAASILMGSALLGLVGISRKQN